MKKLFIIIVFIIDFSVGFIFSAASSVFFGIICFPINALIRSSLTVYLHKFSNNQSDKDLYKLAITQASIGALGYLVGSITGLITYLFILLPNIEFFGSSITGASYNSSIDHIVALRSGTLCVASNLLIYIFIVSLMAIAYVKVQKADHGG